VETKHDLRRRLIEQRDSLSPDVRQRSSVRICERVLTLPQMRASTCVALYANIRSEVETASLLACLLARGVKCVFPRVTSDGLVFAPAAGLSDLKRGAFAVAEPQGAAVALQDIDVVVVPGLGFDRQLNRLGYGRGYYDRALFDYRGCTLGVAFAMQIVESIAITAKDRAMDKVVTEVETVCLAGRTS
jgi:5-formyltetrahydrofolate cyclo-ligase